MRRTKIVCTLGPASSSHDQIRSLMEAGMDVARINFSHGDHDTHRDTITRVREVARDLGRPVAVLGDLQGPKIRIGKLASPRTLSIGDSVRITPTTEAADGDLPTDYVDLATDVRVGGSILLADGLLELIVQEISGSTVTAKVVHGGTLTSNKGINLPDAAVSAPSLTPKDLEDLKFALTQDLEYLALSFVRTASDVTTLCRMVPEDGPQIISKIEMAPALDHLPEILQESAGCMVARGDLGVEIPFARVPLAQKKVIELSNRHVRPVITATQMLESMIENPRPHPGGRRRTWLGRFWMAQMR
jgi:pyruvate kinase